VPTRPYYSLHVASFRQTARARSLVAELRGLYDLPVEIVPTRVRGRVWQRVYLGRFPSVRAAQGMAESVAASHFAESVAIVKRED
jgi:hypothetical protein